MNSLEKAKLALREHILANKDKVINDLERLRKQSNGVDIYSYTANFEKSFSFNHSVNAICGQVVIPSEVHLNDEQYKLESMCTLISGFDSTFYNSPQISGYSSALVNATIDTIDVVNVASSAANSKKRKPRAKIIVPKNPLKRKIEARSNAGFLLDLLS